MKKQDNHSVNARIPRQERARQKVELILEAAILLLDKGGLEHLTTNAVAEKAGVSIGTLYQYFPNKAAILDALAEREMTALSQRVIEALHDETIATPRERIGAIIRAVTKSYGERRRVHRLVADHSLASANRRIGPIVQTIASQLASTDRPADGADLSAAEAFMLSHAFAGVMRGLLLRAGEGSPGEAAIEASLVDLIVGYVQGRAERRGEAGEHI